MTNKMLNALQPEAEYPIVFDDMKRSNQNVLVPLLLHLNYHPGQVNYPGRMVE
jgi:hypothetical protein